MVSVSSGDFVHDGHRLVYYEYGSGSRPFLLLPGLLLPQTMHRPLAQALAERGNRVITLDLLGHGESDRPRDMWRYSMPIFGQQAVALLDHPVLDNALLACGVIFTPLLVALTFGEPVTRLFSHIMRRVPRGLSHLTDVGL